MDSLRRAILDKLKHHDRLTSSDLHHRLGGQYAVMDIEAELIAMDLDGVVRNDMVPVSRITQKGRDAKKLNHRGHKGTQREKPEHWRTGSMPMNAICGARQG